MVDPHVAANFRLSEFKCNCCGRVKLNPDLPVALQEVRDILDSPIVVTSGFRCADHNQAVGGVSNSCHMKGLAADCAFPGIDLLTAYLAIAHVLPWATGGGLGLYSDRGFIHLDVREKRRRWGQIKGLQVSFDKALLELKGK